MEVLIVGEYNAMKFVRHYIVQEMMLISSVVIYVKIQLHHFPATLFLVMRYAPGGKNMYVEGLITSH
jgi:tRNA isopentenyl-2-thiomethyl-A-37 hydroxylase MiaE